MQPHSPAVIATAAAFGVAIGAGVVWYAIEHRAPPPEKFTPLQRCYVDNVRTARTEAAAGLMAQVCRQTFDPPVAPNPFDQFAPKK